MRMKVALVAAAISLSLPMAATTGEVGQTYDLIFRKGTLDDVNRTAVLNYSRTVRNRTKPEAAERDTGEIALSFVDEEPPAAILEFRKDGKHRNLGSFPASVGNPMIMYFYETVVRDMAETSGGSPFYIRNRVKEALTKPEEVVKGEAEFDGRKIATSTVSMRPFAGDPNRARMQGFGDLELQVTVSDAVPGWYLSLRAEAPDAEGMKGAYRSEMTFNKVDQP